MTNRETFYAAIAPSFLDDAKSYIEEYNELRNEKV